MLHCCPVTAPSTAPTPGLFLPYPTALVPGRLLRRYKRFMVDVELSDGTTVTAHTPNTGRMLGCSAPGSPVYLSRSQNPKRKLPYTLEIVDAGPALSTPTLLVGINTLLPNRLFHLAAQRGLLAPLRTYTEARREVALASGSRIDLLLSDPEAGRCYVEIKNVTLVQQAVARFPDAVTARGLKHLRELERLVSAGHRACLLFAVQRRDAERVGPADAIDPEYGAGLRHALEHGVEALAYRLDVSPDGVGLGPPLPVDPSPMTSMSSPL